MKKRAFFLSLLTLLMVGSSRHTATAAACINTDGYGSVSFAVPVLPSRGSYTVWTRMQAMDATHNQYSLEVNSNSCYQIGGSSLTPGQWTWVGFESGDLSKKTIYNFDHTSDNTMKVIGTQAGVKVDRLLLVKGDCVPSDLGNNCQSDSVKVDPSDTAGATEVPPPSNGSVSGTVVPSQTITQSLRAITKVRYMVGSQNIPSTASGALDTTLLPNGKNRLTMQITLSSGSVINEVTTLDVTNSQNALSPFKRWARLNARTAWLIAGGVAGIIIIAAAILIFRRIQLQKRLLHFKGF